MNELEDWVVLIWGGCDGKKKCDAPFHCEECQKAEVGMPGLLARSDWDLQGPNSPIKRCWNEVPDVKVFEEK